MDITERSKRSHRHRHTGSATSVYPGYRRRLELTGFEGTIILENDRIISADLPPSATRFDVQKRTPTRARARLLSLTSAGTKESWKTSCRPLKEMAAHVVMVVRAGE